MINWTYLVVLQSIQRPVNPRGLRDPHSHKRRPGALCFQVIVSASVVISHPLGHFDYRSFYIFYLFHFSKISFKIYTLLGDK